MSCEITVMHWSVTCVTVQVNYMHCDFNVINKTACFYYIFSSLTQQFLAEIEHYLSFNQRNELDLK